MCLFVCLYLVFHFCPSIKCWAYICLCCALKVAASPLYKVSVQLGIFLNSMCVYLNWSNMEYIYIYIYSHKTRKKDSRLLRKHSLGVGVDFWCAVVGLFVPVENRHESVNFLGCVRGSPIEKRCAYMVLIKCRTWAISLMHVPSFKECDKKPTTSEWSKCAWKWFNHVVAFNRCGW